MRRAILFLFAAATFLGCKNNDQFTISGKLEKAGHINKVLLYAGSTVIDSAFVNEHDEFEFIRSGAGPDFYTLVVGEKNFPLVAKNGDEITFNTDYSKNDGAYTISGSEESEKIRQFNLTYNRYAEIIQSEQGKLNNLVTDLHMRDSIINSIESTVKQFSTEALAFAEKNKNNLAGFHAISTLDQTSYEKELIQYADEIRTTFPDNKSVVAFVSRMVSLKAVSVGQIAPLFELPSPDGKIIKLSDYRGKYVLLDFWTSWCPPCREENPNIVKRYNEYKDKGFTVLGVSLDDQKANWLKAIKSDNLTWEHVSELKSWDQRWDGEVTTMYKIEAIPASFLLDREGRIVAKNLRGEELDNFLKNALNSGNTK